MLYTHILLNFMISAITTYLLIVMINEKYRVTKIIVSSIAIIFYSLQALSIATIMSDINYSFLINLFDITNYQAAFSVYGKYSIVGFLVISLVVVLLIVLNKKIK